MTLNVLPIAKPALQGEMVFCGTECTDFEKEGKMNGRQIHELIALRSL